MCVVARICAASNLSVAHELGHVMGLAHDRDTSTKKCSRASIVGYDTQVLGASSDPSASITGSAIAFTSAATNLVPNDTNGFTDVFVRDRGLLTTTRANVSSAGVQANAPAYGAPSIGGGRYVAFASAATNLAPNDTNGVADVFVRDLQTATTGRILPAGGSQADGECAEPSIAPGERWIVFTSRAPNLGAGLATPQVYRWDRLTDTTVLVSANAGGAPGNGASGGARVSDDGRVAFWSASSDLVAGDSNGSIDVFLRDVSAGTTARMSLSSAGAEIAGPCEALCALSGDGRRVAFATASADVVAGDANGATDLYVRDRVAATTVLASVNGLGTTGSGPSGEGFACALSSDGRYVAFQSHATDLVPGDTNDASDVFVRDLTAGTTDRVSVSSSGAQIAGGAGEGSPVSIAAFANVVAFRSRFAVELTDTNNVNDVYVFDRQEPYPPGHSAYAYGYRTPNNAWRTIMAYAPGTRVPYFSNPGVAWQGQPLGIASPSPFAAEAWRTLNDTAATIAGFRAEIASAYCLGDGSGTPCPCGNSSASSEQAGCTNSLGLAGRLVALGGASIASDSLLLRATGMPDSSALFFQGTTQQTGGAGAVFGDGLRCAAGNVRRLAIRMNTAGSSWLPSNGSPPLSIVGGIVSPTTAYYQVWYRNSAAFCSPSTFNLTNGLSVAWQP
jgi:Tol biopolymer transport system component